MRALTFAAAAAHCQQLTLDGRSFRLPTASELMSMIDYGKPVGARRPALFVGAEGDFVWSKTTLASDPNIHVLVDDRGATNQASAANPAETATVRCVSPE